MEIFSLPFDLSVRSQVRAALKPGQVPLPGASIAIFPGDDLGQRLVNRPDTEVRRSSATRLAL